MTDLDGDFDTGAKIEHELLGEWVTVVLARAGQEVSYADFDDVWAGMAGYDRKLIEDVVMTGFLRWLRADGEVAVQDARGMWRVGWPALEIRSAWPVPADE